MKTHQELLTRRAGITSSIMGLQKRADAEKRTLSQDENDVISELMEEGRELTRMIKRSSVLGEPPAQDKKEDKAEKQDDPSRGRPIDPATGNGWRSADGREVRVYKKGESLEKDFRDQRPGMQNLSIARCLRGIVSGDWSQSENEQRAMMESRVMSEATGGAGAYLLPTPLSAKIIDLARAKSVCMRAGGQVVPMDSATLKMAKWATDPTPAWRAENTNVTVSDGVLDSLTFTAHTLAVIVPITIELFEDAQNLEATINNAIAQAMALKLDLAALRGDGESNNPTGILETNGVTVTPVDGDITNYSRFSLAVQDVLEANGEPNAVVMAPRMYGEIDRFTDSTGQPLRPPASYESLQKLVSTQVPTTEGSGGEETEVYVGDFSKLMIGMRTNLTVEVTRVGTANNASAWEKMQVQIRAYLRADVQLEQPGHFSVLTRVEPYTGS